jgi:hypothetical protein
MRPIDERMDTQFGEGTDSRTGEVPKPPTRRSRFCHHLAALDVERGVVMETGPSLRWLHHLVVRAVRQGESDHRGPWTGAGHSPKRARTSSELDGL